MSDHPKCEPFIVIRDTKDCSLFHKLYENIDHQTVNIETVHQTADEAARRLIAIESTPAIPWTSQFVNNGWITPGWHGGKAIVAGKVMFNGYRHNSGPNILYADGAVHSDATRRVDPAEWGLNLGTFAGLNAYTWPQADPYWGNLDRVIPHLEFYHPQSK